MILDIEHVLAYIGPGAGIALMGSFLAVLAALASAFLVLLTWPVKWCWRTFRNKRALARSRFKRVVILGLDGLDPELTDGLLAEGLLPNLARLRDQGSYHRLGTTWPPLSPVAWSSFSTGTNPGKHQIFDFIARNPATYLPEISSVRIRSPKRQLRLGRFTVPLSRPRIEGLRKSKPFWQVLGESGIFSNILRVPITFPPDRFHGVQLSAMCVPDLKGTQGTFTFFVEQGTAGKTGDGDSGGERVVVQRKGDVIHGAMPGPVNSLRTVPVESRLAFTVSATRRGTAGSAVLRIAGQRVLLKPGQYSDWIRLPFPLAPGIRAHGLCRFRLRQFAPRFEMSSTPINIDPDRPVMPISHPRVYSNYLARSIGPFATMGLAEDTWSLSEEVIDEAAFLRQAWDIDEERQRMFADALQRTRRGAVVCVFDGPDRIQHMFWRFQDPRHPNYQKGNESADRHRHVIRDMYIRMDRLVGKTMESAGDDTALFVMSDHGFKPFRRGVDLNAWLLAHGYLHLQGGVTSSKRIYLEEVDWSRTQAYALGLAGIYINLRGRESQGIVGPGEERRQLVEKLCRELSGLRDPETGEEAIHQAIARETAYRGPYVESAADLIIGYHVGYRVSWDSAVGKCGARIFSDNMNAWSGDHCIHPGLVPGILFSSIPLDKKQPQITDIGPTTLELLGVRKPTYMDGESLLCSAANSPN
jgi:predicted AlkP superfamily phosphohydrolase/phosphomutase